MLTMPLYLRAWREERRLRQATLADKARLPQAAISAIETGRRNITLNTLGQLAAALDVSPADLLQLPPRRQLALSRHQIDGVARAVVSGHRRLGPELNRLADEVALLVMGKLRAHGAPGARRTWGRRWHAPYRTWWMRQRYRWEAVVAILRRLDKHFGAHGAVE